MASHLRAAGPSLPSARPCAARPGVPGPPARARGALNAVALQPSPPAPQALLSLDSNGRQVLPPDAKTDLSRAYCLALAAAPLLDASVRCDSAVATLWPRSGHAVISHVPTRARVLRWLAGRRKGHWPTLPLPLLTLFMPCGLRPACAPHLPSPCPHARPQHLGERSLTSRELVRLLVSSLRSGGEVQQVRAERTPGRGRAWAQGLLGWRRRRLPALLALCLPG